MAGRAEEETGSITKVTDSCSTSWFIAWLLHAWCISTFFHIQPLVERIVSYSCVFLPCCLDPTPVLDKHWSRRVNQESDLTFLKWVVFWFHEVISRCPTMITKKLLCAKLAFGFLTVISYFTIKGLLKHWGNANETDMRPVAMNSFLPSCPTFF